MADAHHTNEIPFHEKGVCRLIWALLENMLLIGVQIIGGVVSGSLALIADALHNFSDAAS